MTDLSAVDPRLLDRFTFDLRAGEGALVVMGLIGSISHNTHVPKDDPDSIDDVDTLSLVLPPRDYFFGLKSWPKETTVVKHEELDAVFYSYHKGVRLLLGANPNVLGLLWLQPEHYVYRTPWFDRFIENRDAFSSRLAITTHLGYAKSQFQKMTAGAFQGYMGEKRRGLVERFGYDTKNAAHLIRLLHMGIEFAESGVLRVYRTSDADLIRDIKRGKWSLAQVQQLAADLTQHLKDIEERSVLPPQPDLELVNRIVVETVQEYVCGG